jgi:uncharacterized protein (TIGR03067 family)
MVSALLLAGLITPALDTTNRPLHQAGWESLWAGDGLAALQGEWAASFGQANGERWSLAKVAMFRLTVSGNRYTVRAGEHVEKGLIRITPGGMDLLPTSGPLAGQTLRGIYELKEQRLVWCLARPGAIRPIDFAAGKGSEHIAIVFFRLDTAAAKNR